MMRYKGTNCNYCHNNKYRQVITCNKYLMDFKIKICIYALPNKLPFLESFITQETNIQGNIIIQGISRTILPFSRTKCTTFKGNKSTYVWKPISYLFNAWLIIDILWYSLHLTPSSCLIHLLLFKFKLTWDIKTVPQYTFSSTVEVFFYRHNIQVFLFQVDLSDSIFSRTFPDF